MKTAVVTGGSSGIGLACAEYLAKKGYTVFEFSRSGKDNGKIRHITCDVTDEQAVIAALAQVASEAGSIDLLVNNAGFGISGAIECSEIIDAKRQFEVNFFGAVICAKSVIPYLRESRGCLVNISSVGGPISIPFQAYYSCTKAAVNAFTLALVNEVRPFNIRVCAIMPGDIKTGFTGARDKSIAGSELYGERIKKAVAVMEKDEQNGMSPKVVARKVYKMAKKKHPKPLSTIGLQYKAIMTAHKLLPARLVNWVVGKLY